MYFFSSASVLTPYTMLATAPILFSANIRQIVSGELIMHTVTMSPSPTPMRSSALAMVSIRSKNTL